MAATQCLPSSALKGKLVMCRPASAVGAGRSRSPGPSGEQLRPRRIPPPWLTALLGDSAPGVSLSGAAGASSKRGNGGAGSGGGSGGNASHKPSAALILSHSHILPLKAFADVDEFNDFRKTDLERPFIDHAAPYVIKHAEPLDTLFAEKSIRSVMAIFQVQIPTSDQDSLGG